MKLYHICILIIIYTNNYLLNAQDLGKHPSNIDWKSIDTKNVRVIFPKTTATQANRIANLIDYIHTHSDLTKNSKFKKLALVLQNQQVISNGFVSLSPFRSEFFTTPPQNFKRLGTTDWLDLLTIHEYRHALQYTYANRGFTKFMHIIGGENGWASALHFSIPSWYLEGDAVLSETLLTKSGRGRNPNFFKEQRALLLNRTIYPYMKARNGSYKDLIPNHYALGFVILNHLRNSYGPKKGRRILADAARYKYPMYPFSSAMKRHTGKTTSEMYKEAYTNLQKNWNLELKKLKLTKSKQISKTPKNTITNYKYPHYLNNGNIVCIKNSYQETPHLIQIKNKQEQKLTTIGITAQEYLSCTNKQLVWTERQKDLRRSNLNYSNIIRYDINTGTKKKLTTKSKLFSPHLSKSETNIVAVQSHPDTNNNLVILDANSGKIIKKINNPKNYFISYPKWADNDSTIIYLAKNRSEIAFFKFDFKNEKSIQISNWTTHNIGSFSIFKNRIYFTASYSGINNIYELNLEEKSNIRQITSVKVGVSTPFISNTGSKIIYSEFTQNGDALSEINLSELNPKEISFKEPVRQERYQIKTTTLESNTLDAVPLKTYPIKDYKSIFKDTKLHSWGLSLGNMYKPYTQGLNLSFKNILADFSASLNLLYNTNEKTTTFFNHITYSKYFVELNLNASKKERNTTVKVKDYIKDNPFSEISFGGGFSIPLSQIHENYFRSFSLKTNYIQHLNSNSSSGTKFNFGALESKLSISNNRRTALQNLAPKFGQSLELYYNKSVNTKKAHKIALNSRLFFPGFLKNHSTSIHMNWQKENLSNPYQYPDFFSYARGYTNIWNDEAIKISLNYEFPITYPDWGFWGITYFKRVRAKLFYDISRLKTQLIDSDKTIVVKMDQNSYGTEIIFDNTFFNILPVSLGLRNSFLLNTDPLRSSQKKSYFQFFIQLNL